ESCGGIENAGRAGSSPRRRLGGYTAVELFHQLLAKAIETAVGHDQQKIPSLCFGREILRDGIRAREGACLAAECTNIAGHRFRIHTVVILELLRAKHAA